MKSSWMPILLLLIYLTIMFIMARLLDLLVWYRQGDTVDPFVLSVRQLKQLLEVRGISYTGYFEKQELAQLVESSAEVSQGELEELENLVEHEEKERFVKVPESSQFSGRAHFYEQVEDTKDSVWLVQVVPSTGNGEPLLDDYKWHIIRHHVAPFAIRTGVFDCKLDQRLCLQKGWNQPLLLLAMPKGTTPKDKVIIRTCTLTRPQQIITWLTEQLSIRVHNISSLQELSEEWVGGENLRDIKVLLLTHMLHPPLFLAALSIKFTGRIKFGMMTLKKEDDGAVKQKLKLKQSLRTPSYLVVTPEHVSVYGRRQGEHHNFWAMNALLRAVCPDTNDVFLLSMVTANMIALLNLVQVQMSPLWKRVAYGCWTIIAYNMWLFAAWLLIYATHCWPVFSTALDQLLVIVRNIALTDIGNNLRNDIMLLYKHPLLFIVSFTCFVIISKRIFPRVPIQRDASEHHGWWNIITANWLFESRSREEEERIDLLLEQFPNFWMGPSAISNEYIKDLPVWKYRANNVISEEEKIICLMDEDITFKSDSSSSEEGKTEELVVCPVKGQIVSSSCAVCLEVYHSSSLLCGLPCGHNYHKRCIFTWLHADNHQCPICRWPVYKQNHPRLRQSFH